MFWNSLASEILCLKFPSVSDHAQDHAFPYLSIVKIIIKVRNTGNTGIVTPSPQEKQIKSRTSYQLQLNVNFSTINLSLITF